jgi:hypothetical protein
VKKVARHALMLIFNLAFPVKKIQIILNFTCNLNINQQYVTQAVPMDILEILLHLNVTDAHHYVKHVLRFQEIA